MQSGTKPTKETRFLIIALHADLRESGYKLSEINDTVQVMLSMKKAELEIVQEDEDATIMERTIASAMIKSLKSKSLYSLETLLSRAFGQPKQEVSTEIILPQPLFPDVIIKPSNE